MTLLWYFLLAYGISWVIWLPLYLPALGIHGLPVLPFHHALGAFGPFAAAFIMTWREQGKEGAHNLARRLFLWRGNGLWLAIALFSPFAVLLLAVLLADVTGMAQTSEIDFSTFGKSAEFPAFGAVTFFLYNIFSFGYGEETGWRGYALPRLQARFNAFWSSTLLTLGWALWHIPLFLYRPGYTGMDIGGIIGWVLSLFTGAILLTWLYNSSRGSILVVAIFHATIDIAFTSTIAGKEVVMLTGMLVTLWGIAVLLLAGPRHLARLERQKVEHVE